jgi:hypothetical protein
MIAWRGLLAVLTLMSSASMPGSAAAEMGSRSPRAAVESARSVRIFRLHAVLEDETALKALRTKAASDNAPLSASAVGDLKKVVLDAATYADPAYVPSCGFVVSYAFLFESPDRAPTWWLLTNCGKAALVNEAAPVSTWSEKARYLSKQVLQSIGRCNGITGSQSSNGRVASWKWRAAHSCLEPQREGNQ